MNKLASKKLPWNRNSVSSASPSTQSSTSHVRSGSDAAPNGRRASLFRRHKEEGDEAQDSKKEYSLNTILPTPEARADFLMLVASCTEAMRQVLLDTFDPDKTGFADDDVDPVQETPGSVREENDDRSEESEEKEGKSETVIEETKVQTSNEDEAEFPEKQKTKATEEVKMTEEERQEQARKEREKRVAEVEDPKMQELKEAALTHFDDWNSKVLGRVGSAVNEKIDEAEDDTEPRGGISQTQVQPPDEDGILQDHHQPRDPDHLQPEDALTKLYPIHKTTLLELSEGKRILLIHSLILLLLSLEYYPAESRLLLLQVARGLDLPFSVVSDDETKVAQGLLEVATKQMNADEETKKKAEESAVSRRWKIGLGAVAGAALIGITGGLAAPVLAAGIGTVMGGIGLGGTAAAAYLGALAGSAPLIGALFGAYGGRMTSKAIAQYAKEISDFAFLPLHGSSSVFSKLGKSDNDSRRFRVAIGICGYLNAENDVTRPWKVISPSIEAFALRWELEALVNLGNALTSYIKSAAWALAKQQVLRMTVLAALTAGLWPLALAKASRVIDNPFSVARVRAEKAGEVLAEALINRVQGERPVTLVGYSLGSRVVYFCLTTLADRKAFGLIESVVLMGSPVPSDSLGWRKVRSVVSGRVVNAYSANDYLLAYLYRTTSLQSGIAGIQKVKGVEGVENVDVSKLVNGHTHYKLATGRILREIGFEDLDLEEVKQEEQELKAEEQLEEKERKEKEGDGAVDIDKDMDNVEQEIEKKKQESGFMGRVTSKLSSVNFTNSHAKTASTSQTRSSASQTETEPEEKPPALPARPPRAPPMLPPR